MHHNFLSITKNNLIGSFNGYASHDKCYKFGGLLFGLSFFAVTCQIAMFENSYFDDVMDFFYPMMALTFSVGAGLEFWSAIKKLLLKTWVRWVGGIVSFFVFKLSQAQSDDFINELTGIDPSFLSFSSSVLTAVYLPYSWLVVVSVFITLYFLLHWVFMAFEDKVRTRQLDPAWKYFSRLIGVMVIFWAAGNLLKFFQDPESLVSDVARNIVVRTEYFAKTHCKNVRDYELSADIGGGYISIFDTRNKSFRTEICDLTYLN